MATRLSGQQAAAARKRIYARDQGVCYLCDRWVDWDDFELDHVTPISRGGSNAATNLAVSHHRCNQLKGARLVGAGTETDPQPIVRHIPR